MLLVWICTQQQTTNPCLCWPSVIDRILLDVTQRIYAIWWNLWYVSTSHRDNGPHQHLGLLALAVLCRCPAFPVSIKSHLHFNGEANWSSTLQVLHLGTCILACAMSRATMIVPVLSSSGNLQVRPFHALHLPVIASLWRRSGPQQCQACGDWELAEVFQIFLSVLCFSSSDVLEDGSSPP